MFNRINILKCIIFILFFVNSIAFSQSSVSVLDTTGELTSDQRLFVRNIIETEVKKNRSYSLTAKKEESQFSLYPSIVKLGQNYVATLKSCYSKDVKQCGNLQMLKLSSLDELDNAFKRLTIAVLTKTDVTKVREVGEVLDKESEGVKKSIKSKRMFKLGLGGGAIANIAQNDFDAAYDLMLAWSALISEQFAVNIEAKFVFTGKINERIYGYGLGPQYYFNSQDTSPYIKANLSYFFADRYNDHHNAGMSVTLGVGMEFFRTSDISFFVESNALVALAQIDNKTPYGITGTIGIAID